MDAPERVTLADVERLVDSLIETIPPDRTTVLGITGPPGAGKSTFAEQIASVVGDPACVAPMDGFHRSNEELAESGLLLRKGIPESFDADAFVAHVEQLHTSDRFAWPTFDRSGEVVVPAGMLIDAGHRLVVVEGNYLLLRTPPWDRLRALLDTVWYLDVPANRLIPRLRARHAAAHSRTDALIKVQSTDLPNAELVAATRERADVIIEAV
jgi:pantothenate kinase